jgi:predicted nucleotide-binding protein
MKAIKEKRVYVSQEDVPAYPLEEALRIPTAIFENYGKSPTAPMKVAAAMSLAPGGVQFRMLAGSAIAYGLTLGGYNAETISIEPLAKRILTPTQEGDDVKAKREAFLRPRIHREFIEKYNNSPLPKEEIAINVLEEIGVPRDRAVAVFKSILETSEKLGLIQDIKGKKYLFVDASISAVETNGDSDKELEEEIPSRFATSAAPVILPSAKPANGEHNSLDTKRAKRVFITHGKNMAFVEPIKKLLQFGELEAVVAVEKQTVSEPVPDKVMNDMRSCGAAIIHVEGELKLLDAAATEHVMLNPNVLIEIGAAMALYGKRFILLVKEGVNLPSNLQGLYQVRYTGENLDGNVTIKLLEAINELKKRPIIDSTIVVTA